MGDVCPPDFSMKKYIAESCKCGSGYWVLIPNGHVVGHFSGKLENANKLLENLNNPKQAAFSESKSTCSNHHQ